MKDGGNKVVGKEVVGKLCRERKMKEWVGEEILCRKNRNDQKSMAWKNAGGTTKMAVGKSNKLKS